MTITNTRLFKKYKNVFVWLYGTHNLKNVFDFNSYIILNGDENVYKFDIQLDLKKAFVNYQ